MTVSEKNIEINEYAGKLLDQVNEIWNSIETKFRREGILQSVFLPDLEGAPDQVLDFGIYRHHGEWRICCVLKDDTRKPISDCSSNVRVNMLMYIDILHECLLNSNMSYARFLEMELEKYKGEL